ncbi:sialidase family protein [Jiangella alba]|uniref:BNR repeat-like domain-containing protein n=1 Tax=Jiangella alba TaxID=561176 RepID=A0A1H5PWA9_9ACTN|nr:sialidase family protein [Jiangella alba]SEF18096.1 BNR repeat-like domain-containing protein [Jiangella alba]
METIDGKAEHVTIYRDPEWFAAWPFNHGLWRFDTGRQDELVVSFARGRCAYRHPLDLKHENIEIDSEYVTMRSTDGGRSWPADSLHLVDTRRNTVNTLAKGGTSRLEPVDGDWTGPDFCLTAGFGQPPGDARHRAYIAVSRDRARTFGEPVALPHFVFNWMQIKPDYVVRPDGTVLLFASVGFGPAGDGRAAERLIAVYASKDRGRTWHYLSALMSDRPDAPFTKRYYPSPVQRADGEILAALRCEITPSNTWPELWGSRDGGVTWSYVSRIADFGGPTALVGLDDGRLAAVYGYRVAPYGIRARVSDDAGRTWGPEIVLRDDGGSSDLGYPRAVQLSDGSVFAAYYFNAAGEDLPVPGGVRHIAGTRFQP